MRNFIRFLSGAIAGIIVTLVVLSHCPRGVLYPESGRVCGVDYENDIVTVEDCNGFLWEFKGTEDWCVDDHCAMIMFSRFTRAIYDDVIIDCKYTL